MEWRLDTDRIPRNTAAWLGALWAILFGIPSFYWAAGGTLGQSTIAADLDEALGSAAEPAVVAFTGVLKLLLALFSASFAFPRHLPRMKKLRLAAGAVTSGLLILYGVLSFADHFTMVTGIRSTPDALGEYAAKWHLFFWDPLWALGGVLLGLATRNFSRLNQPQQSP